MKIITCITITFTSLYAHENVIVHERISQYAFDVFLKNNNNQLPHGQDVTSPLGYSTYDEVNENIMSNLNAQGWYVRGAVLEDAPENRCVAHFYNPIDDANYYNKKELHDPRLIFPWFNRDSFSWATSGEGFTAGPIWPLTSTVAANQYTWSHALDEYYLALTSSSAEDRSSMLGKTFFTLGHVGHLLQDLSQPEHTRNDTHFLNGKDTPLVGPLGRLFPAACWIETWGKEQIENLLPIDEDKKIVINPINWRVAKFKKLKDFWDRDFYKGPQDKGALDADAQSFNGGDPTKLLGLAEFTNGNFLGIDASYIDAETESHQRFPFPSLKDTNASQFTEIKNIARDSTWKSLIQNDPDVSPGAPVGTNGYRCAFIKKTGAGIPVEHHSVLTYSGLVRTLQNPTPTLPPLKLLPANFVSLNAPSVLRDLHKVVVKKAVAYSAGLLDYFFRGRIEANAQSLPSVGEAARCRITVKNISGADLAFVGGDFKVFVEQNWDESRTPATHASYSSNWSPLSSVLQPDQTVEIECDAPSVSGSSLIVIYQGNIGAKADGTPSDEMDQGKACAITPVTFLP